MRLSAVSLVNKSNGVNNVNPFAKGFADFSICSSSKTQSNPIIEFIEIFSQQFNYTSLPRPVIRQNIKSYRKIIL
jgi:hypothetical protein